MASVEDILGAFGFTGEIAISVSTALADPTSSALQKVVNAYAENGQLVPTKLMTYLLQINEQRHPEDTYRKAAFPWLLLGGAVVAFLLFRKRGK